MPDAIELDPGSKLLAGRNSSQGDRRALNLNDVQQHLQEIVNRQTCRDEALAEFVLTAAELTSAELAVYFQLDDSGALKEATRVSVLPTSESDTFVKQILKPLEQREAVKPFVYNAQGGEAIVGVSVAVDEGRHELIAVVLRLEGEAEPFVVTLQMIAAYATLWTQRQSQTQLDWEANAMAALVELMSDVENAGNQAAACLATAGKLKTFLRCQQIAVGLRSGRGSRVAMRALSDKSEFDRRGETAQLIEDAMNESVIRQATTIWPPPPKDRHATLAHRRMAEQMQLANIVTVPLYLEDELVGAVTMMNAVPEEQSRIASFAESSAPYIASALSTAGRMQGSFVRRAARWLVGKGSGRRMKVITILAVAIAAILAIPMPHKIGCKCRLEPLSRRFAVAPYDGVLQETFVKPGDVIEPNQLLARMDDREITWKLSGLLAERNQAAKKRDASLSEHDVPAAQMAQLEVERLELKIRLLRHQQENLEIRSRVKGIVVDGDLEDTMGAPVHIGDSLFEIAALSRLRLEIAVPEEELPYVATGMIVMVQLDGFNDGPISGKVVRLRPRAEIRNSDNVFVAEVELANDDGTLRPGMSGRAKVVSRQRMLGWILFHRAYEKLTSFFG